MTDNFYQRSAKIYQFPVRGHTPGSGHRDETKPAAYLTSPRIARVACGSAWYHEEAVEDAERARKH